MGKQIRINIKQQLKERHVKYNKDKKTGKIIIALIIVIICGLGAFFVSRAELRFHVKMVWAQLTTQVALKEIEYSDSKTDVYNIEDIENDSSITFNQSLVLVNSAHTVDEEFPLDLIDYKETGVLMDTSMIDSYAELSKAVTEETDDKLYVRSNYRDMSEQAKLYKDSEKAAKPGASEHQTGLALDVYVKYFGGDGFVQSPAGQFVNANCWRYGFIIRYPLFKQHETGVGFEPWHIRYVGKPHAQIIFQNSLSLEEYIESLEIGKYYEACGYIISRQSGRILYIPQGLSNITISPDNQGNYIITGMEKDT